MEEVKDDWLLNDVSDDHYGLWEVEWAMNSKGVVDNRKFRINIVAELVRRGMIDIFVGKLGEVNAPVPREEAIKLILNEDNWRPRTNPDACVIAITTSKDGDDYLNNRS